MGIYANYDKMFGIRMYRLNEDDSEKVLFEIDNGYNYCLLGDYLTYDQRCESYRFYKYKIENKENIHFSVWIECTSTLDSSPQTFRCWQPIDLETFLKRFTPLRGG